MISKNAPKCKRYDFTLDQAVVTKSAGNSGECIIEGYANTATRDRVGDVCLPESFAKHLPTYLKNPVLLANHDWNDPCGVVLEAKITDKGLWIKARISDTRADIKTLIAEGCLRTLSIGYNEVLADYDEATKTKYIKELELLEISIVTVPANTEAMFTQAIAKTEPAVATEGKSAGTVKTAAELNAFIHEVREAVGTELNSTQVLAVCAYFNDLEITEMKTKNLLALLRGQKSVEAAPVAAKADPAASAGEPAPAAKPADAPAADAGDAMKQILEKLDAIAQGIAQVLEASKADSEEDVSEEADDSAADPAADPAAAGDKADPAPACDEEEMSEDEVEKELAEIAAEISALEDAENA